MSEIAFLVASAFHQNYIPSLLAEHNYTYPVYAFDESEASKCVEKLIDDGVRVLVAAGRNPEMILKIHKIPVIAMEYSVIDFAKTVRNAKRFSKNVAIFVRYGRIYDMALRYKATFGDSIIMGGYETEEDSPKVMEYLKSNHIEVVVCGGRGKMLVQRYGYRFECVQVMFDDGDVLRCAKEAERILEYIHQNDESSLITRMLCNKLSVGCLAVDRNGYLLEINDEALKIIGTKLSKLKGIPIKDTPLAALGGMLQADTPNEQEQIISLGLQNVAVKLQRCSEKNWIDVAIFTVIPTDQLQAYERNARTKLLENKQAYAPLVTHLVQTNERYRQLYRQAASFGKTESPVLICGPFGSGCETFAQHIHETSRRCDAPFVALNCAALPPELPEAQLFGRTAPTAENPAAVEPGAAMLAAGGTLYLENVEALVPRLQAQLETVLSRGELRIVGSNRTFPANIRILASTSAESLLAVVQSGEFREDLYYQLSVLQLTLPPLFENSTAISELLDVCLAQKATNLGLEKPELSPEAQEYLCKLRYPGNIPQLSNIAERLVIRCNGRTADLEMAHRCADALPAFSGENENGHDRQEAQLLRETLTGCGGSRTLTAQRLGMSTATLWRKMKKYSLM